MQTDKVVCFGTFDSISTFLAAFRAAFASQIVTVAEHFALILTGYLLCRLQNWSTNLSLA
jgi:hypothetical protein